MQGLIEELGMWQQGFGAQVPKIASGMSEVVAVLVPHAPLSPYPDSASTSRRSGASKGTFLQAQQDCVKLQQSAGMQRSPGTHLVENASHTPDIGAPGVILALTDLRGEVVRPRPGVRGKSRPCSLLRLPTFRSASERRPPCIPAPSSTPSEKLPSWAWSRSAKAPVLLGFRGHEPHPSPPRAPTATPTLAMPKSPILMLPQ